MHLSNLYGKCPKCKEEAVNLGKINTQEKYEKTKLERLNRPKKKRVPRKFTDEHRQKIREALLRWHQTKEGKINHQRLCNIHRNNKENINKNRQKTCLERYGVKNVFHLPIPLQKQKNFFKDPENIKNRLIKAQQTCLEKYGDANYCNVDKAKSTVKARTGFNSGCDYARQFTSKGKSKIQYEMISMIPETLRQNARYYHKDNNQEMKIGKYYFDFVHPALKKIIEFNGTYWHADPRKYTVDQVIKYPNGKLMTAQQVWDRDNVKIETAVSKGYTVLVIWERDFIEDKNATIEKIKEFLND